MTATNLDPVLQAVSRFRSWNKDDELIFLGLLYREIGDSIPANIIDSLPTETAVSLVRKIENLSPEEQRWALEDLISVKSTGQNEVMLDPNPGKAFVELTRGGTEIPTGEYASMSVDSKLAFWYLLGERLGNTITGIPQDYNPPTYIREVLNTLKALNANDLVSFLKQVLGSRE